MNSGTGSWMCRSYLGIVRSFGFAFDFMFELIHIFMREKVVTIKGEVVGLVFDPGKPFETVVAI